MQIEIDDDQFHKLLTQYLKTKEAEDPINSLSIIFDRYGEEDGSDIVQPSLFFYPDWDIDFEFSISLTDVLQEYLDSEERHGDDEDHRILVTRLLATTNEWIEQQKQKNKEQPK